MKCAFFQIELQFLGHLITRDGYKMIPSFIEPILNWPMVQTKYNVQSFLGSCNYHNKFIDKYSIIEKPLTTVLKRPRKEMEIQHFSSGIVVRVNPAPLLSFLLRRPSRILSLFSPNPPLNLIRSKDPRKKPFSESKKKS